MPQSNNNRDDASNDAYPLGHDSSEVIRLNRQVSLLREQVFEQLCSQATSCLDIGCGVGSMLPVIRKINPSLSYVGIDISEKAIEQARRSFASDRDAAFKVMSATNMRFHDSTFDLVLARLVLWAIGPSWPTALNESRRVLSDKGLFYSFEPDNDLFLYYPKKTFFSEVLSSWFNSTLATGLDPFIGKKVRCKLLESGFQSVSTWLYTNLSNGDDNDGYTATANNLRQIFLGQGPSSIGLKKTSKLWRGAINEISSHHEGDVIVETYFVNVANKYISTETN